MIDIDPVPNPRRLLLRGLGILAVLFGPQALARLAAEGWPVNASAPGTAAAGIWLMLLLRHSPLGAWCAGGLAIAGAVLLPVTTGPAETVAVVLLTITGTWLCIQLTRDYGLALWPSPLPGPCSWRSAGQAVACCIVVAGGHFAASLLGGVLMRLTGAPALDQADAMGIDSRLQYVVTGLVAGVREEVPLLALVVTCMAAARCPAWQIITAVCLVRVIPHAYLGLSAVTLAVAAAVSLWIYQTSGLRIAPVVAGHTLYNALALLGSTKALLMLATAATFLAISERDLLTPPRSRVFGPARTTGGAP